MPAAPLLKPAACPPASRRRSSTIRHRPRQALRTCRSIATSSSTRRSGVCSTSTTRSIAATTARPARRRTIDGRSYVNFASYNYLGLNGHPDVVAAAKAAIDSYGTSVSASRLVAGERPMHRELERALAELLRRRGLRRVRQRPRHQRHRRSAPASSRSDLVLHDDAVHNSVIDGIRLSGATRARLPAQRPRRARERCCAAPRREHRRALIVVEGLYSHGRRHRRPAAPRRAQAALRRLADGRRGALARRARARPGAASPSTSASTRRASTSGWARSARRWPAAAATSPAASELVDILKYHAPGLRLLASACRRRSPRRRSPRSS